jgi:hypothetical protein
MQVQHENWREGGVSGDVYGGTIPDSHEFRALKPRASDCAKLPSP